MIPEPMLQIAAEISGDAGEAELHALALMLNERAQRYAGHIERRCAAYERLKARAPDSLERAAEREGLMADLREIRRFEAMATCLLADLTA